MLYETVMGWMAAQRNEGIAIGVREKAVQTARRALERGFSVDVAAELTGLTAKEVAELK